MENIRLEQAQDLIKKSTKNIQKKETLKKPQKGTINVKIFENLFKDIIRAEESIYNSIPSHELTQEEAEIFCNQLINAREKIDEILSDFAVIKKQDPKEKIKEISQNYLFITTKNNIKKSIQKHGIDVQRILVASVPLQREDMKELNPKIPEQALQSIDKKIEHIKNDIKRKTESLKPEKIVILAENDLNGQLLAKRAEEQYDAVSYLESNLKDTSDLDFLKIIENL